MANQATLPLIRDCPPYGRPDSASPTLRRQGEVEYGSLRVREVLNRCAAPHLPFDWTINPYRGCEFGCTYCYARYTHEFLDFTHWRDFERKIFVKQGAARSLLRRLKRSDLRGKPIAIGTATDPYQPAELHHRVTRSLLEAFDRLEGLTLSITTKSPLVLRDLDLLRSLDRKHAISVHLTITSLDTALARKIETRAPSPQARLEAAARLAEADVDVAIYCMPVMPGINAGSRQLLPIFEAAREIGAYDVVASPLFLRKAARARFWPWLRKEFPDLEPRYRRLFRARSYLQRADRERLLEVYRRLRLEMGFPDPAR